MKISKGWVLLTCIFIAGIILAWGGGQEETKPITLAEFNKIVSNQDTVVLVYCSAGWCGVCKKVKPIMDEIETYNPKKLKILHVDADRDRELNEEFELNTLPFIMLYKKGEQKWVWTGIIDKQKLRSKIDPHLY